MAIQFSKDKILLASKILYDLHAQADTDGINSCLEPDCCNPMDIEENDKMLMNLVAAIHVAATGGIVLAVDGGLCPCNYLTCQDIPEGVVGDVIIVEPEE